MYCFTLNQDAALAKCSKLGSNNVMDAFTSAWEQRVHSLMLILKPMSASMSICSWSRKCVHPCFPGEEQRMWRGSVCGEHDSAWTMMRKDSFAAAGQAAASDLSWNLDIWRGREVVSPWSSGPVQLPIWEMSATVCWFFFLYKCDEMLDGAPERGEEIRSFFFSVCLSGGWPQGQHCTTKPSV